MIRPRKSILSQVLIILTFVGGMVLNYKMLYPIFEYEEYYRLSGEINTFFTYIQQNTKICGVSGYTLDSLARRGSDINPYDGFVCVADKRDSIIYCSEKRYEGTGFKASIKEVYGEFPMSLIDFELSDISLDGKLKYDYDKNIFFYAKYDPRFEALYFYAVPYSTSEITEATGIGLVDSFVLLNLVTILGGILIIVICFFNMRKSNAQFFHEESTRKSMEAASLMQHSMLPSGERSLMQIDIDTRLIPAQMVGGDFYYYMLKGGRIFFCIGDVSGKGVSAALYMSRAVTLFRNCVLQEGSTPAIIASIMNTELCYNNEQNYFATVFIGMMNCSDGHLVYCNCGHNEPLYWNGKSSDKPYYLNTSAGVPLGFDDGYVFSESEMEFDTGATFVFYTDGVTEARSRHNGLYGADRLADFIDGVKTEGAVSINDFLTEEIASFEKGVEQSDDITLVTFRNIPAPKVLEISNDVKQLKRIGKFTDGIFEECSLTGKERIRLRSGLDEAMTNCVRYAYDGPGGKISLKAEILDHQLVFTLTDSGHEFNPLQYETPVPSDCDIRIGGLGIPMIKSSFDTVEYARQDGNNILKMIKKI